MRFSFPIAFITALQLNGSSTPAQSPVPEITELHRRVALMRRDLGQTSALAERYIPFLGRAGSGRFVIPQNIDPAFFLEFYGRAGGPAGTEASETSSDEGLALLSVRHWDGIALGIATRIEQLRAQARPVLIVGPMAGRPDRLLGDTPQLDDGAPDGADSNASINGIANMIAGWTFYSEVVAAATRAGWRPGILASVLLAGSETHNAQAHFRMATIAPAPISAGTLGARYLAAVDSILDLAAAPAHQLLVDSIATRLRELRRAGATLFAGSCGHYLLQQIPRDAQTSRLLAILPGGPDAFAAAARAPARNDVMLWFGYGGFDCPNATVSDSFQNMGMRVVVVSDDPPADPPTNVIGEIRLPWQLPDGVVPLPFAPSRMAPISSVDMALHYIWFRRLLTPP